MKELIKRILREQLQGEFDFDGLPDKEPVSFNKNQIFGKINNLRGFLFDKDGLNMQFVINKKINDAGETTPRPDMVVQKKYANLLFDLGKIDKKSLNRFLWVLNNDRRVYVDGKWHIVNKSNSNYSFLAQLLTDILLENNLEHILQPISETNDMAVIKDILLKNKTDILEIMDETLDIDDLIKLSEERLGDTDVIGNKTEDEAIKWLQDKGMRVMKVGGDGDLIDRFFGIDVFVQYKGKIFTVQVKTSERQKEDFIRRYKQGKYQAVDILLYKGKGGEITPVKLRKL